MPDALVAMANPRTAPKHKSFTLLRYIIKCTGYLYALKMCTAAANMEEERHDAHGYQKCVISCDFVVSIFRSLHPRTDLDTVPKVLRNVVQPRSGSLEGSSAEATPETIQIR
jgi:hypothetical protein